MGFGVLAGLPLILLRSFRESSFTLVLGASATIAVSILVVASALSDSDAGSYETNVAPMGWKSAFTALSSVSTAYAAAVVVPELVSDLPRKLALR